jgi:hypothetical protein
MRVGGQRHALAALPPGKTRYPLYRRLGGPQGRSGNSRPHRVSIPDRLARSESLYRLSYPDPHRIIGILLYNIILILCNINCMGTFLHRKDERALPLKFPNPEFHSVINVTFFTAPPTSYLVFSSILLSSLSGLKL